MRVQISGVVFWVLSFEVWGSGFGVEDLGFRVQGLGLRFRIDDLGSGFRVKGSSFWG